MQAWMGRLGAGLRSPHAQSRLSPGPSPELMLHFCVRAHADRVSTQVPLGAGEVWPLRAPPKVPSSLLPGGCWRAGTPLTWITVSSPSGVCCASPSPGSLEAELISDRSTGPGRKPGLGCPASVLLAPWPGQHHTSTPPGSSVRAPSWPRWAGHQTASSARGVAGATATLRIEFPWKQECRPCCHGV